MDRDVGATGLALSGGAILGSAHIGVLQALEDAAVRVTHVAGTSMGALVGTLYAFGLSGREIAAFAEDLRWPDVTAFTPSRMGLLSQERLRRVLRGHLGDARLEDAPLPLALVAADISTGEKVILRSGDAATTACASACVPGLFTPIEMDGRLLVDGGLVENLPISPLREWRVDRIIAVDVHLGRSFHRPRNLAEVLGNALDIALSHAARSEALAADILITPDTSSWSRTQMNDIPALVEEGYRAARRALSALEGE